uniref:RagB/SusD family nutrient uptake outer membrane protein n=1 Tax=uncultured Draconibacterium sp. TaxID=1573823 RepID=UPI003217EB23
MKALKYITSYLLLCLVFFSCNEDKWLEEKPYDFYAPENSYETSEQFNSAVARLYELTNSYMIWSSYGGNYIYQYTSDIGYDCIATTHELNSYIDNIIPESSRVRDIWTRYYRIIFDANVIINRIEGETITFNSEAERNALKAEAMFFRAFAYRCLAHQFGGVPIVLDELSEPKRDFVRDTREAVYNQAITDLTFAASNLPSVSDLKEDGRLTKAAANHLLAELYISVKDYDKAITAASSVIDDPNYELMKVRFGTRKDEPGDVYWDLFRRGNQNRNSGVNTESIWVAQYEYMVEGGGSGSDLARFLIPLYWQLKGDDGKNLFFGHSSKYGGRGIGWMAPSKYLLEDIWTDDPDDIRNSEYNIIRDIVADNPESAYYGQKIVVSGAIDNFSDPLKRWWSAIIAKAAPINNFPEEAIDDPETGATNGNAVRTFRDHYFMRLAETYLLRAEAYLGKGESGKAAVDINVVRARANATPVEESDVDIDYILDERARELNYEEFRIITLMRVGKLAERVRTKNPMHNGQFASHGVEDYHNLWPIPQSEIERNTEAVLEQNPGYN